MGQVPVKLNGVAHVIGCKDGEEDHVRLLVGLMEEKVRTIRAMGGQFSEARMLLHVALLLADDAFDLRADMQRLRSGQAPAAAPMMPLPAEPPPADTRVAERLLALAERIEGMSRDLR